VKGVADLPPRPKRFMHEGRSFLIFAVSQPQSDTTAAGGSAPIELLPLLHDSRFERITERYWPATARLATI
jgi:hypothetical protein